MSEDKKTSMVLRIDQAHKQHKPHYLGKSDQILVRMMCRKIAQQDIGAREAGMQIASFEGVATDLLNLVNSTLPPEKKIIRDPVHAAVMMGNDRLHNFLAQYVEPNPELAGLDTFANSNRDEARDQSLSN